MKKLFSLSAIFIFSIILIAGCAGESKSDSPAIAKVGKTAVTEADFLKALENVPEWARPQFADEAGKQKFLEELIRRELIYNKALAMKLDKDKDYTAKVEEFKKMTLVSMILKKEIEEKSTISEEEVKTYFEENSEKFRVGTQIKASHILVKTEDEANDIAGKLEKGENFEALAKTHSQDPGSAEKGGDLGYFGQGRMVPEFEQAALGLKPGETSGPVKSRFGFHIIKLTDVKKGELASFDQTKEPLGKQLLAEKRKKLFEDYVEKLTGESEVTRNEEALAAVALPWQKAGEQQAAPDPHASEEAESTEEAPQTKAE